MTYTITKERGDKNYSEIEPLYRMHYAEMKRRLDAAGTPIGEYNPRLDVYFASFTSGHLLNYIVRFDGKAVGYSNVYLTSDMHNSELIAQEDTIFMHPDHRTGMGRKLVRFILDDLQSLGVKRVMISPVTDLRVAKIWRRMGFKDVATQMSYQFQEN